MLKQQQQQQHARGACRARSWQISCAGALRRRSLVKIRTPVAVTATDDGQFGEDVSDIMKQDMERFAKQQQQQQQPSAAGATRDAQQAAGNSPLKEAVDKVLIADFFFILLVLAWLGAGLAEKGALHSSNLINAWMPLWPMVFQPAIGVLMLGALVSGGLNWLASRGTSE